MMKNKLFKTALFGYSKTDVCNYITRVEEDFNDKLEELTLNHKKDRDKLLLQIVTLEEEKNELLAKVKYTEEERDNYKDTIKEVYEMISPLCETTQSSEAEEREN